MADPTAEGTVLAVDVGGTKLAAGTVTPDGEVTYREEVPTPRTDAEGLWDALVRLIDGVLDGPPAGVGVGCGGPMTWPAGEVSPLNIDGWRGFPLRMRLATEFPDVPVRLHNDAVCFAVGEHWRGAGAGSQACLGMVVSTGVGGGLVVGGRVVDGPTGNAGHIGHVVVDPHGPACFCGGRGCLEAIASGPSLVRWALAEGWEPSGGDAPTGQALAHDAGHGHPVALAALTRGGQAVGVALASVAHLLDLDVAVVGGGLAQVGGLLMGPVEEAFRRHARLQYAERCRVEPARLGRDAGLIGAAALVLAGERYWSAG